MRSKRFTDRLAALEADKMKLKDPSLLRTEAYINGAWVKGDIFLTMGAGNIWRYAEELGKHYND